MKLMAGVTLFVLCALTGEGRARRFRCREQTLSRLHALIREISDRQLSGLVSFQEAVLRCPPSPERELLLNLLQDKDTRIPLLTPEETAYLSAYVRSESRTVSALRTERDALLVMLQRDREKTKAESAQKGQVWRSVGYLSGAAVLLLVL